MSSDRKERVRKAIERYEERQQPKDDTPTRRNAAPEREVQNDCLTWMRLLMKWSVQILEAKATYDPRIKAYRNQSMKAGTADCVGNTDEGHAVVIEFKAPGKLSTFAAAKNFRQQTYMIDKINSGCFAVVVDSVSLLRELYKEWRNLIALNKYKEAKEFLLSKLPKRMERKNSATKGLFDE